MRLFTVEMLSSTMQVLAESLERMADKDICSSSGFIKGTGSGMLIASKAIMVALEDFDKLNEELDNG